jgi:hypothetical protein
MEKGKTCEDHNEYYQSERNNNDDDDVLNKTKRSIQESNPENTVYNHHFILPSPQLFKSPHQGSGHK